MSLRALSVSAVPLLAALLVVPAQAEVSREAPPSARPAPMDAEPTLQLAQKQDDKEKNRQGGKKDKGDAPPQNGNPKGDKAPKQSSQPKALERQQAKEQAKQKALERQQAKEQAKQKSLQTKQDAWQQKELQRQQAKDKAVLDKQQREDAFKQKQLEKQQAKDKALQDKQLQKQQAKDKALNDKLQADKAREDAFKQKQLEKQQAKDKALQDKQLQKQQAKDKALNDKLQADKAREDAFKQRQLEKQQAIDREKARKADRVANKGRKPEKFDRKKVDTEFEKAREEARGGGGGGRGDKERWREGSASKFEKLRRERQERDVGSGRLIIEPDKRVIVRRDDRTFIRHDEGQRLKRVGRELRRERRKNGMLMVITAGLAGALIYTLQDDHGRVVRRSRKGRDGREYVLFDNRPRDYGGSDYDDYDAYVDLPPPVVRIPRDEYIVDYDRASPEELYDALNAPPVEPLDRSYSLDEVRQSYSVLERMRRVDLDAINFEFGSWEVAPDQYPKLERIARAMQRILDRAPDEVFFIEGHTDAVGSEIDNLSLSDRRAETVAVILSEEFGVPPENLTTQGYGEEHLKVFTDGPSRINRRVSVRRITPLLSRDEWSDGDER